MGRYSKAIYLKHNLQALSWLKLCAIGVGRRLARNGGAMGVEIIYSVNVLSDRGNPYRVTSVPLTVTSSLLLLKNVHFFTPSSNIEKGR